MRELLQSTAANVMVWMEDSASPGSGKTGLTLTVTLSKDAGAFAAPSSGTVTERTSGWYKIALDTTDTNTLGDLVIRATATGAVAGERVCVVYANKKADIVAVKGTTLAADNMEHFFNNDGNATAVKVDDVLASGGLVPYTATFATRTIGSDQGGTYASTYIADGTYFSTGEDATNGLEVRIGVDTTTVVDRPINVTLRAYYTGGAGHEVDVYIWDYDINNWTDTGIKLTLATSPQDFDIPISILATGSGILTAGLPKYQDPTTGKIELRLKHNVTTYNAAHRLHIDLFKLWKLAACIEDSAKEATLLAAWRSIEADKYVGIKNAIYPITLSFSQTLSPGSSIEVAAVDVVVSGGVVILQDQQVIGTITSAGFTAGTTWAPALLSCSAIRVTTVDCPGGNLFITMGVGSSVNQVWSVQMPNTSTTTFWIGRDGSLLSDPDEVGQVVPGATATSTQLIQQMGSLDDSFFNGREKYWQTLAAFHLGTSNWTNAITGTFTGNTGASTLTLFEGWPDYTSPSAITTATVGTVLGSTFTANGGYASVGQILFISTNGALTTGGTLTLSYGLTDWIITIPQGMVAGIYYMVNAITGQLTTLNGVQGAVPGSPTGITEAETQAACAAALTAYPVPSAVSIAVAVNSELSSDHGAGSWVDTGGTGGTSIINVDEVKTVRHANLGQMPNTGEARKTFLGK